MSELNKYLASKYDGFKLVAVRFPDSAKIYTYKTTLPFKEGDTAVVDTPRKGLAIVSILGVSDVEKVYGFNLKWLVSVINTDYYQACLEFEKEAELTLAVDKPTAKLTSPKNNSFGSRL